MARRRLSPLQTEIAAARATLDADHVEESRQMLEGLRRRAPRDADILRLLVDVYRRLEQPTALRHALEDLVGVVPDARNRILLGLVCIQQGYPYRGFDWLDKHPDVAAEFATGLAAARQKLAGDLPPDMSPEEGRALRRMQEDVRLLLAEEQFKEALKTARHALERWPENLWLLATTAQLHLRIEDLPTALDLAKKVLEVDEQYLHGLTVMVRSLAMMGEFEAAIPYGQRLMTVTNTDSSVLFEKIRALTYISDFVGMLETFTQFDIEQGGKAEDLAGIYAWVGIAALSVGHPDTGRRLLQQAQPLHPGWALVTDNLADIERSPAERHGPFALRLNDWLGERFVAKHIALVQRAIQGRQDAALEMLQTHPYIARLLQPMLLQSDPPGRQLAIEIAKASWQTELLAKWVGSSAGPDALRVATARWLRAKGILQDATVPMWINGEERDMELFTFDLRPDPPVDHRQQVALLREQAALEFAAGRWDEARVLVQQALSREPSATDLQLDDITILFCQGHLSEAAARLETLPQENGRVLALRLELRVAQNQLEEAVAMVKPNLSRSWARSDFARFCDASMRLNVAVGQPEENEAVLEARRLAMADDAPLPWRITQGPTH